jgi:hypothetical protein
MMGIWSDRSFFAIFSPLAKQYAGDHLCRNMHGWSFIKENGIWSPELKMNPSKLAETG